MKTAMKLILFGFIFSFLQGCGVLNTMEAWTKLEHSIPRRNTVLVHPAPIIQDGPEYQQHIDQFALMALFSKVVYRKDIDEKIRIGSGCKYLAGEIEHFGMPNIYGKKMAIGWRRMFKSIPETADNPEITPCYDKYGLYYETYEHIPALDKPVDMVVIAIRGTENFNNSERLADWMANFSATIGTDPEEYRLARLKIGPLIDYIYKPGMRIFVTGHSLGGGIAQQMAYTTEKIEAAYVFDTSPVTNWSQMKLMKHEPIKNPNPTIFRISHTNEALAPVRFISTRLTTTRLHRSDFEFNFQKMGRVDSHEMGVLACHLAVRVSNTGGDFDFPAAYVKTMIKDSAICPRRDDEVDLPDCFVDEKMKL